MGEINKVVVRFVSGSLVKGTTQDFFPARPTFHIQPLGGAPASEVRLKDLKAVFFVHDFDGDPNYKSIPGFAGSPESSAQGRKIAVRFKDGEVMCGYTLSYSAERDGFFILPADGGSNNLRVYIVGASCAEIKIGPAAEALALKARGGKAA